MVDLAWLAGFIQLLYKLYFVLAFGCLIVAIFGPKRRWLKIVSALVVIALFGIPAWKFEQKAIEIHEESQKRDQIAKKRFAESKLLFEKRCEGAGEKVFKTHENVDRVAWLKWRGERLNFNDQFALTDPYGQDCTGEECILNLLKATEGLERNPKIAAYRTRGYSYVEARPPGSDQLYEYHGIIKLTPSWTDKDVADLKALRGQDPDMDSYTFQLSKVAIPASKARFGIDWEDISTREDREHWIAGSLLKIIDLSSGEVIAERRGYLMDPGQGATGGGRSPWSFAREMACPPFLDDTGRPTRAFFGFNHNFIFSVLKSSENH